MLRHPGSVLVLAYHAITDLPAGPDGAEYSVSPAQLSAQLDALESAGYRFIDLGALLSALDGTGPMPERGALITFDDCYEDLGTVAAPLLAARGIPAVGFAVAGRLGGVNDWDDAAGGERLRLLDGNDLRALSRLGIEVGAHSVSHPRLTDSSPAELTAEVGRCGGQLEAAGVRKPRAFAYPYGRHDAVVVAAVRQAGFQAAFTTQSGVVTARSDRYRLPRMEVRRRDTGLRFRLRLAAAHTPAPVRRALAEGVRPLRAPVAGRSSTPPPHGRS